MASAVEFLPGAIVDFNVSVDWYSLKSSNSAVGFTAAMNAAVDQISMHPEQFPCTDAGCRYLSLKRYPFQVVFLIHVDRIAIVAIAHVKRRPGYWRQRV